MYPYLFRITLVLCSLTHLAAAYYAFNGVQDNVNPRTGQRPQRLPLEVLASDEKSWSLYLQALRHFQTDRKNINGYFQIAGIHGRPYTTWDGVTGPNGFTDPSLGYCTHGSILFPTWHRPYLALFESRINAYAVAIANSWKGADAVAWQAAAHNLRIPYWDWASNANIPVNCSTATIIIKTFTGRATISNPLWTYRLQSLLNNSQFPDLPGDSCGDIYLTTVRCPDSCSTSTNTDSANGNLNAQPLRSMIYSTLTQDLNYTTFASYANEGPSLELIHNIIHGCVGGQGHMSYLSYSAFDPIFWLHHTNVDRLFAIWQAINPQNWFPNALDDSEKSGTFTIQDNGGYDTSFEPLTPFNSAVDGSNPWTSDSSRSTRTFGYTYPEINDWSQSPSQLTLTVRSTVNKMYGPPSLSKKRSPDPSFPQSRAVKPWIADEKQYFVSISVGYNALPTKYDVLIFLDHPPLDSKTWLQASNLAGSLPVYPTPKAKSKHGKMSSTHGEVPLTDALYRAGLGSADNKSVVAYLVENLCWRVQKLDGSVVNFEEVKSLKVRVYQRDVELPDDMSSFPKYGRKNMLPEVTRGKSAGH